MSNKYSEYLKQVDTMTLEEVETVENEIAEDYKTVVAYNKKMETKKKKADKAKLEQEKKYKYPFVVHIAGRNIETDHIFERDSEYTEKEITAKMREHQYYDFTGDVSFDFIENENVLLPIFRQHKKG